MSVFQRPLPAGSRDLRTPRRMVRRSRLLLVAACVAWPALTFSAAQVDKTTQRIHPLFQDRSDELAGPLAEFAEELSDQAKAQGRVGRYAEVLFEEYQKGDETARLKLYTLSKDGDPYARTIMGWMFDNGVGVAKNSRRAADLFLLASSDVPLAAYNLGVLYMQGRGVEKNIDKAVEHLMRAKRIAAAYVQLANYALEEKQGLIALNFAKQAAQRNDPTGLYLYGRLLLEKGESKSAVAPLRRAASANQQQAVESMIYLYERGIGLTQDPGMAAGWWIINEVLFRDQTLQAAEEAVDRFSLSKGDKAKGIRFARKWLLNREPMAPFDYTATLNFSDIPRR